MENNKCLILCIVIILCIIGVASSGSHKSVDIDEKIAIDNFDSGVTNYSTINNTGLLWETYLYSVFFDLENVSSWYDGGEVIVYFYNDSGIVLSDEVTYKSNNTTTQIDNNSYNENFEVVYARGFLHSDKFVNITHVTILLINDGVVVFNETRPFDMNNYENDTANLDNLTNTISNDSNSSSPDDDMYYVASANSDIYHEWYCTQASRITDANKITFQTREEAENQGYAPCKICCP